MSLIVEDGTGLSAAESYISVADADTYHADRGNTPWSTMTTLQKEQALRRGTEFMLQIYRGKWKGYRTTNVQALDWPRASVDIPDSPGGYGGFPAYVPINSIPVEIKKACAEMGYRAASGELLEDQTRSVVREKIGPIETEYDRASPQRKRYVAVDAIVGPFLGTSAGGAMASLVRA